MDSPCRWEQAEHEAGLNSRMETWHQSCPRKPSQTLHWCEPAPASGVWKFFCLELTWAGKIRIQMLVVPPLFPAGFLRKGQWCWLSHKLFISDSFNTGNKQGIESSWACLGLFPWILFLSAETQIRSALLKPGWSFIIYLSNWWEISETHGSKSICCC